MWYVVHNMRQSLENLVAWHPTLSSGFENDKPLSSITASIAKGAQTNDVARIMGGYGIGWPASGYRLSGICQVHQQYINTPLQMQGTFASDHPWRSSPMAPGTTPSPRNLFHW